MEAAAAEAARAAEAAKEVTAVEGGAAVVVEEVIEVEAPSRGTSSGEQLNALRDSPTSLILLINERDERIRFLENTLQARDREISEMLHFLKTSQAANRELGKTIAAITRNANIESKENRELHQKLEHAKQQIQTHNSQQGSFIERRVNKPFHELASAQKTPVKRHIKEDVLPRLDEYLKKRKLEHSPPHPIGQTL